MVKIESGNYFFKSKRVKKMVLLNKSSHSSASRSSRGSVTAVPGFIQKSCSPQRSCGSLGTCMQMS